MDEQKQNIRPTKKQRELLTFIDEFITEHGYSPSYREIMTGCNYNSVATVSLHVNNLIKRGHIIKREHSARSLEVVTRQDEELIPAVKLERGENWFISQVEKRVKNAENNEQLDANDIKEIETLVEATRILGFEEESKKLRQRLDKLETDVAAGKP